MKYQMREQMFAIGDDYWIETDTGERAFKVDGKALRIRKTLILETPRRRRAVHDPEEAAQHSRHDGDRAPRRAGGDGD